MDTELDVLCELFVEFLEILSVFTDFLNEFHTFLGNIFLDDFKNFVVLEEFSADVKW